MSLFKRNGTKATVVGAGETGANQIRCIKVLGSGCKSCRTLLEAAKEAVDAMGLGIEVEYVTDLQEVMTYGVMRLPALVVNEQVISTGKVLKAADAEALLRKFNAK